MFYVSLCHQAPKVNQEHQVLQVGQALSVREVLLECRGLLDPLVYVAHLDHQVRQYTRVHLEYMDLEATLDTQDHQVDIKCM